MSVSSKICGLKTEETIAAAIDGGTQMIGLNFYAPSPRSLDVNSAAKLAKFIPASVEKVGLIVDEDDIRIEAILSQVDLDYLQLHGSESPERIQAVKTKFGLPVIKAIKIRLQEDLNAARDVEDIVDMLLFDAKPPAEMANALPGGNGIAFDWNILSDTAFTCPWMLSGGLNSDNVAAAVEQTGAQIVDVSSGVEGAPGKKDPAKIKAFLDVVSGL